MDDPIARLRAEMDQAKEGVKEFAGTLWGFYAELVQQGFTETQAFALTLTYLTEGLRRPMPPEGEE